MKRNSFKYVLFFFVIAVWGLIIYKVVKVVRGSEISSNNNLVLGKSDSTEKAVDSFSIIANYSDPFLKRNISMKSFIKNGAANKKEKPLLNTQKKTVLLKNWPNIIYAGLVSSFTGNKSTVLITINGINSIMKKGDLTNEIELVTITKDSVKLKFQGEYRHIKRYGTK